MLFLSNRGGGGGGGGNSGGSSSGGGGGSSWFSSAEKKDPADLAKEWKRNLQKEMRHLDRDILNLKRQEDRAMKECKALAKKNQLSSAKVLAKEIARTRKTIERMHTSKAQMNSVCNNLQTSMSMLKMQGCIAKSADIMHAMNELVNIKDLKESMGSMAREMERAGLIEEMMSETMDMMDDAGIDAEADKEVDKIITEITAGVLAPAGATPVSVKSSVAAAAAPVAPVAKESSAAEEPVDAETQDLLRRLQAL